MDGILFRRQFKNVSRTTSETILFTFWYFILCVVLKQFKLLNIEFNFVAVHILISLIILRLVNQN